MAAQYLQVAANVVAVSLGMVKFGIGVAKLIRWLRRVRIRIEIIDHKSLEGKT